MVDGDIASVNMAGKISLSFLIHSKKYFSNGRYN